MKVIFYVNKNARSPVKEFITRLQAQERACVLACLKNIEDLGFDSPRVQFRQIKGRLWEIKIRTSNARLRIFYVCIQENTILLLHTYQKQTQRAPIKEIHTAEKRMKEALTHEKNNP